MSSNPVHSSSQPKCTVCGMDEARSYYGGLVCRNCRVFFYRVVMSRRQLHCRWSGNCKVLLGNSANTCSACRFRKCLENNMDQSIVGRVRRITFKTVSQAMAANAAAAAADDPERASSSAEPASRPPEDTRRSPPTLLSSPGPSKPLEIRTRTTSMESPPITPENIGDSVSVSDWIPLLIELEMAVNEIDIGATLGNGGQQNTPEYYIWMGKQFAKYLGFCPEIRELSTDDRALLYWNNSLLFGTLSHEYYSWLAKKLPSSTSSILTTAEILFMKTQLSEVEFVILKILCLLHPVATLSEPGQALIIVARTRFINLLTEIGKLNEVTQLVDYDRTGVLLEIPQKIREALSTNSFTCSTSQEQTPLIKLLEFCDPSQM